MSGINPALVKAVIAAIHMNAAGAMECTEMGGAIVEHRGTLERADVEFAERGIANIKMYVALRRGDKLVAIWHTHPKCPAHPTDSQFSQGDVEMQHKLGIPSFIYVQSDNSLRGYFEHRYYIINRDLL